MKKRSVWDVRRYDTIDSTNLEARRLLSEGASAGLVVIAGHQTAGRGRLDRSWLDHPGKSLLVSLVLKETEPFRAAAMVALSARAAVTSLGGKGPLCKWPNDLVYEERKVGGILSESYRAQDGGLLIVGLGMNVGYLPGELKFSSRLPPTSLLIEEGKLWSVEEILQALLNEVRVRLYRERDRIWEEYRDNLAYTGREVFVENYTMPNTAAGETERDGIPVSGSLRGILMGVDAEGNLELKAAGKKVKVASGDLIPLFP